MGVSYTVLSDYLDLHRSAQRKH